MTSKVLEVAKAETVYCSVCDCRYSTMFDNNPCAHVWWEDVNGWAGPGSDSADPEASREFLKWVKVQDEAYDRDWVHGAWSAWAFLTKRPK